MIEVKNLTKKYGDTVAVDNLSFRVEEGEIYGFLGPNGAGKSTTMNIITGYLAATEGEVLIGGYDILKDAKKARSLIGYLPEVPPLYQDMTVREYLMFAAELRNIAKADRMAAVETAEETMKISDVSQRLIKNLSKGYRQRVGFAQALLGLPEVLILDEPTVGLDPKQIIEIRDLIRELGKKHTVILSSHILSEVSAVCDKIMIMSKGRLVACDTPENLMTLMQPVVRLRIEAKADEETVRSVLLGISGINHFDISPSKEDGILVIEAEYDHGKNLRDQIALAFAEAKCLIVGLKEETASLEDIFLELTETGEKTPAELIKEAEGETTAELTKEAEGETAAELTKEAEEETAAELTKEAEEKTTAELVGEAEESDVSSDTDLDAKGSKNTEAALPTEYAEDMEKEEHYESDL